ncbi:MAG: ribosome hibernation-promoting factor, HPF/YfiA family, partial [Alphaproteobacteria bacterium]
MQVQVSGKHMDIGDALTGHVQTRLEGGVSKYFDRTVDGRVVMSREGPMFHVDCSVHLASGITLQAQGEASDVYAAFDGAADRLEKRVRRYKRRLKNHHKTRDG